MRNPGAWTLALTLAFTLACGSGGTGAPAPDLEKELDAAMKELDSMEANTDGDIKDAGADGDLELNDNGEVCCNATEMGDEGPEERYFYAKPDACDPTQVDASPVPLESCILYFSDEGAGGPDPSLQQGDPSEEICCSKYDSGTAGVRGGFERMTRKSCLAWKTAIVMSDSACDGKGPSPTTTTGGASKSRTGGTSRVPNRGGGRTRTSGSSGSGGNTVRGR